MQTEHKVVRDDVISAEDLGPDLVEAVNDGLRHLDRVWSLRPRHTNLNCPSKVWIVFD